MQFGKRATISSLIDNIKVIIINDEMVALFPNCTRKRRQMSKIEKDEKNRKIIFVFPHQSVANFTLSLSHDKGNFVSL